MRKIFSRKMIGGVTLVEMLVSLAILAILASVVLPFGQLSKVRTQEAELRHALRSIRLSIDKFHDACVSGKIQTNSEYASSNCYPKNLEVLFEGVESTDSDVELLYFIRRIPSDPFAEEDAEPIDHWEVRGYTDSPDGTWAGDDVFDIRVIHDTVALDGSEYRSW